MPACGWKSPPQWLMCGQIAIRRGSARVRDWGKSMSAQIGQVSEVTGSNIKAMMDATQLAAAQSGGDSSSVTVGSLVEVKSGSARVLGIVSAIRGAGDKGAVMDISLVGQFIPNATGGSDFRRGVARWPAIGSPVV